MQFMHCWVCGVPFAVSWEIYRLAEVHGADFYCPKGCKLALGESALQLAEKATARAQELLEAQRRDNESLRLDRAALERRVSAKTGVITKLKKRSAQGACPCCTKLFTDLAAHMKDAHPGYGKEAT